MQNQRSGGNVGVRTLFPQSFRQTTLLNLDFAFLRTISPAWKKRLRITIGLQSGELMAMAGTWEQWQGVRRCAIFTTTPNADVAPYHDRLPAVLRPQDFESWLDHSSYHEQILKACLRPFPNGRFRIDVREFKIEQITLPL